jgi:hypothetical protein
VTARLLEAAAKLDYLSTGMTLIAFALLFVQGNTIAEIIVITLGLVAKLYAVRIAFDAKLLADVAAGTIATADLDGALVTLALVPAGKTGRDWTERCRGAKKLIVICGLITIAQCIAILATL